MKRSLVATMLVLAIVLGLSASVSAAEPRISTIAPTLTFEGTTAQCKVSITGIGKQINATLELWQGNILIDSWTGTATTRLIISETCEVDKGKTYTLKVSGTIGGESFIGTPVSAKCN